MTAIIGVDVGTTHVKAGVFDAAGRTLHIARRSTVTHQDEQGLFYYDPDEIFATILALLDELFAHAPGVAPATIGIASMAETGLLFDVKTDKACSPFVPWFDSRSSSQAAFVEAEADVFELFARTGLRPNAKYGLCKILWLQAHMGSIPEGVVWLSMADYVMYRLTGVLATDYTLAARTHAFRIDDLSWDAEWLRHFGLRQSLFPDVLPSGRPVGQLQSAFVQRFGCKSQPSVCVSGHDHLCGTLGAGLFAPGDVLDSMGTAETLLGTFAARRLTRKDYESGLVFGLHVIPKQMFWLGSVPASGGSVEWFRQQFAEPALSYEALLQHVQEAGDEPTGMLYFPYLAGAGAPKLDGRVTGALLGLTQAHKRGHVLKAVLEGAAYEVESIRRCAMSVLEDTIREITISGGGSQNRHWLQIKADVMGCTLRVSDTAEATLLGAALLAGVGCGLYSSLAEVAAGFSGQAQTQVSFHPLRHTAYQQIFTERYLPLQKVLHSYA